MGCVSFSRATIGSSFFKKASACDRGRERVSEALSSGKAAEFVSPRSPPDSAFRCAPAQAAHSSCSPRADGRQHSFDLCRLARTLRIESDCCASALARGNPQTRTLTSDCGGGRGTRRLACGSGDSPSAVNRQFPATFRSSTGDSVTPRCSNHSSRQRRHRDSSSVHSCLRLLCQNLLIGKLVGVQSEALSYTHSLL